MLKFKSWLHDWSRASLGLDLRTMALVRMGIAVLILIDLVVRASAMEAHYSDAGVIPLELYHGSGIPFAFSLHAMGGSVGFQAFLFLLNALAAVALFLGWRTRLATLGCWVLMTSLHNRNFLLLNGGDTWLRILLFWAMFLPWGEKWSLDSRKVLSRSNLVYSAATAGWVFQVFLTYIMAALFKTGPAWWSDGTATHLTMGLAEWSGEWAYYLLYYPETMRWLTFSILVFELVGPLLFFAPIGTPYLRTFSILGFVGFHLGLATFIEIGIFPFVGIAAVCALLPDIIWETNFGMRIVRWLDQFWQPPASPLLERKPGYRLSAYANYVLMSIIFYVFAWNAGTWNENWAPPPKAQVPGHWLRIDQYWSLFAPEPPKVHNWFLVVATLKSGEQVDLMRDGAAVKWDCPKSSKVYKNQRWKRLLVSQSHEFGISTREPFLRYMYERWKYRFPDMEYLEFIRFSQTTNVDYEDSLPSQMTLARMNRDEF